jgi:hypothetical protein
MYVTPVQGGVRSDDMRTLVCRMNHRFARRHALGTVSVQGAMGERLQPVPRTRYRPMGLESLQLGLGNIGFCEAKADQDLAFA